METTSGHKFPKGANCSIAAAHEVDNFSKIYYSLVNPSSYITSTISRYGLVHEWHVFCIRIHKIKPSDIYTAPLISFLVLDFYHWVSLDYTLDEVILVAHNASFERS